MGIGLVQQHLGLVSLDPDSKKVLRNKITHSNVRIFKSAHSHGFVSEMEKVIYARNLAGEFTPVEDSVTCVCELCLCALSMPYPSIMVSDNAVCGLCGEANDCYEFQYLFLYDKLGFSEDFISASLPRVKRAPWDGGLSFYEMLLSTMDKWPGGSI